ncbi:MAG: hypothetical protein ACOCZ7_00475 [Armatimonadota bacterium]
MLGVRIVATALLLTAITCSVFAQELPRKKLIQTGWDQVSPERLVEHMQTVEQQPFHGQVIRFNSRGDEIQFRLAFQNADWDMEAIEHLIDDLKAAQEASVKPWQRFLLMNANPGDVDFFDDAGWASIVEHWRIAARVAREGGLEGILFDPEPYHEPYRQFSWTAQPQYEQHDFAEYHEKARQRGAEVMEAIASEYPDMTLFTYFMNSVNSMAAQRPDPVKALAGGGYDLYPGFIDGWLDVIPATMTLVDGCEQAYRFNSHMDYLAAYNRIKTDCQWLVSPKNRAKYRAQVQVGFGFYLDPYINPPDSRWYIDPQDMERVERLGYNLRNALDVTDEYVWVYGEKASWWPNPHPRSQQPWEEALAGITDQVRAAADPADFALHKMAEEGEGLENLLTNGDFSSEEAAGAEVQQAEDWVQEGAPPGWSTWQHPESDGSFAWDRSAGHEEPGAARMTGFTTGCFLQKVAVKPGKRYGVVAWRKIEGEGDASIRVRWQNPENAWHAQQLDVMIDATGPRDEWVQSAGGGRTADDVVWYDDVVVFRLD